LFWDASFECWGIHIDKSRNLLGGTTSIPFFPIPIKHVNPSYSNSSEPNTSGIDRYFPLSGTHRDSWGQSLAESGCTLAARIPAYFKATHQFKHLKEKLIKGPGPPCNLRALFRIQGLARSFSLGTTRHQQKMAGGPQQSIARHKKRGIRKDRAGINLQIRRGRNAIRI